MFKKINKTIYIEGMKCDGCVKRVKMFYLLFLE